MLSRRELSDMSKGQAAGITVSVIFAVIFLFSIFCNLLVRRIKPRKYFLTSINPLVLVFTFPYHIYQLVRWLLIGKSNKAMEKDIEEQSEPSVDGHGRGMEDVNTWVFEQSRTYPSPHRVTLPQHKQQQPLDLGLPNQIHLQMSKMTDPAGRQYIVTQELPKKTDLSPSQGSIGLPEGPTAMRPGHLSTSYVPSVQPIGTSHPYSIEYSGPSRDSPYETNGRHIIGGENKTCFGSPPESLPHVLSTHLISSGSSQTSSEGESERDIERFVVGDDEDEEKEMEDIKL